VAQRLREAPAERQRGRAVSAPVTERGKVGTRTAIPEQRVRSGRQAHGRPSPPAEQKEQKGGQRAARKAYERRDDRLRRLVGVRSARTSAPTGRAQFVLLIMALLAIGLVATLWFSTAAAADSYRLQDARAEARELSQQAESLHRQVAVLESAPELARRAAQLGMVPVQDPARLVVAPDGAVSVVGEPRAAAGPPPRPAAPPAPPPAPDAAPAPPQDAEPNGAPEDPAPPGDTGEPTGPGAAAQLAAGEPGETVVAQGTDESAGPDAQNADGVPPASGQGEQGDQGGAAAAGDAGAGAPAPQNTGTGEG
jgi:hypothetical protein